VVDLDRADKAIQDLSAFVQKPAHPWRRGSPRVSRNMVVQPGLVKFRTTAEENLTLDQLSQFAETVASMAALEVVTSSRDLDARETFRLGSSEAPKVPQTEAAAAALQLRLRLAVWDGDVKTVRELLQEWPSLVATGSESEVVENAQQGSAQMALALAIRLRHLEIVKCLLDGGADILADDGDGWRLEAHLPRAFPDVDSLLAQAAESVGRQKLANWKESARGLAERLRGFPDCDLAVTWAFSTWVPALGRLLPQDTVRVRKLGARLRVDYTLKSFSGLSWEHGRCSVLACLDQDGAVHFLDHEQEKIDCLERRLLKSNDTMQERARRQRRRPLKRGQLNGDNVTIEDTNQTADCGDYQNCKVYNLANLEYTTLVLPRVAGTREKDGKSKWKGLVQLAKNMQSEAGPGAVDASADALKFEAVFPDCERAGHRPTVEALPPASVAHVRRINANVLMSTEFPLTRQHFVAIADALSSSDERYLTIKEFFDLFETVLPEGFPVQFTIPLVPALSATLSFTQAHLGEQDPGIFDVPLGFRQAKSEAGTPTNSARNAGEVAREMRLGDMRNRAMTF